MSNDTSNYIEYTNVNALYILYTVQRTPNALMSTSMSSFRTVKLVRSCSNRAPKSVLIHIEIEKKTRERNRKK